MCGDPRKTRPVPPKCLLYGIPRGLCELYIDGEDLFEDCQHNTNNKPLPINQSSIIPCDSSNKQQKYPQKELYTN